MVLIQEMLALVTELGICSVKVKTFEIPLKCTYLTLTALHCFTYVYKTMYYKRAILLGIISEYDRQTNRNADADCNALMARKTMWQRNLSIC